MRCQLLMQRMELFVTVARGEHKRAFGLAVAEAADLVEADGEWLGCQARECFGGLLDQCGWQAGVVAEVEQGDVEAVGFYGAGGEVVAGEVVVGDGCQLGSVLRAWEDC